MDEPFGRLRELSYAEGGGTWFSCELRFTRGSRSYRGHAEAEEFPFPEGTDIPETAPLEELAAFPRGDVPRWLLDALPTAVPVGLREPEDRWPERFAPGFSAPEPLPVSSGELAYTPIEHMAVHGFAHNGKAGEFTVMLNEKAPSSDYLLFIGGRSRTEPSYWVAREDMRGTDTGVISCALDDRRLVLRLTPQAADGMETETVLVVDLNLKPAEIEELRVTLRKILLSAPPDRMPSLIGF